MHELGITDFNVINVTMVLLYLKKPLTVLKTVRKYLAKGGAIVIRDLDDGLCIAFPGNIQNAVGNCVESHDSGARNNGRQIFSHLLQAGFNEIRLENLGVSTCNIRQEDRKILFNYYFGSLLANSDKARVAFESLSSNDNFFFSLGLMLFTARR
jgi:hypothetical protein